MATSDIKLLTTVDAARRCNVTRHTSRNAQGYVPAVSLSPVSGPDRRRVAPHYVGRPPGLEALMLGLGRRPLRARPRSQHLTAEMLSRRDVCASLKTQDWPGGQWRCRGLAE